MRKLLLSSLLSSLLLLTACAHQSNPNTAKPAFIQGKATVLQVDNALGMALLNIDGHPTKAYWDTDVAVPFHVDDAASQHGGASKPIPLNADGDYRKPVYQHVDLAAKPGDTILFRGMKTRDELLLRTVQVVPN